MRDAILKAADHKARPSAEDYSRFESDALHHLSIAGERRETFFRGLTRHERTNLQFRFRPLAHDHA